MSVPQQLLDYLYTLITPDHVGGKVLVALDLGSVGWEGLADEEFSGLIALGEPTPGQLDQMWRMLKPGAHFLLIAPDHCPLGYRGACALEDRGFEIRDAILIADEPGHLHYSGKVSSKERNEGVAHLAAKRVDMLVLKGKPTEDRISAAVEILVEAGVGREYLDDIAEGGIPVSVVPPELANMFKVRAGGKSGNHHPTLKPQKLLTKLLSDIPMGSLVLDPFMGSGSQGLACMTTGHAYHGIELQPDYFEVADARVRHHAIRLGLGAHIESDMQVEKPDDKPQSIEDLFGF